MTGGRANVSHQKTGTMRPTLKPPGSTSTASSPIFLRTGPKPSSTADCSPSTAHPLRDCLPGHHGASGHNKRDDAATLPLEPASKGEPDWSLMIWLGGGVGEICKWLQEWLFCFIFTCVFLYRYKLKYNENSTLSRWVDKFLKLFDSLWHPTTLCMQTYPRDSTSFLGHPNKVSVAIKGVVKLQKFCSKSLFSLTGPSGVNPSADSEVWISFLPPSTTRGSVPYHTGFPLRI